LLTVTNAVLLAGCAGPSAQPATDPEMRERLIADVGAVKTAAMRADRSATEAALATLTRDVAAAQAQGKLDPVKARLILAAGDRVAEDARMFPAPAPPTVVITVPQPVPAPVPPADLRPPEQRGGIAPEPKKPEEPQPKEPRQLDRQQPEQDD
jgi:hypothetical protein